MRRGRSLLSPPRQPPVYTSCISKRWLRWKAAAQRGAIPFASGEPLGDMVSCDFRVVAMASVNASSVPTAEASTDEPMIANLSALGGKAPSMRCLDVSGYWIGSGPHMPLPLRHNLIIAEGRHRPPSWSCLKFRVMEPEAADTRCFYRTGPTAML